MSRDLYTAAYKWIGHFRGGLASATIAGCAGFAAMSGSSIAAAVTMGRVALPEMKRFNYSDSLATGAVAAGGTLGILIPPSTGMIIYAILTEQSIGKLFIAGTCHKGLGADHWFKVMTSRQDHTAFYMVGSGSQDCRGYC